MQISLQSRKKIVDWHHQSSCFTALLVKNILYCYENTPKLISVIYYVNLVFISSMFLCRNVSLGLLWTGVANAHQIVEISGKWIEIMILSEEVCALLDYKPLLMVFSEAVKTNKPQQTLLNMNACYYSIQNTIHYWIIILHSWHKLINDFHCNRVLSYSGQISKLESLIFLMIHSLSRSSKCVMF